MKKLFLSAVTFILLLSFQATASTGDLQETSGKWKAGVARVKITPESPMWMAGYGSRKSESEGTLTELWAKALALEDARGNQGVIVTADVLGFPKNMSDNIRNRLKAQYNISKAQVILSGSHTHSGPVLRNSLYNAYPLDEKELAKIEKYSSWLEDQVVKLVGNALKSKVPVQVFARNGVTRFQVNRRNNTENKLIYQTELKGPNDYAVPVIKVEKENGDLLAVAFGYACHNTVLNINQWSGDYAGFAQLEIEKAFPGTTAMFFEGTGADQNPLPRRTIALAQQYGEELAAAVKRVLKEDMKKLSSSFSAAYSEIDIPYANPPSIEELKKTAQGPENRDKKWATGLLQRAEKDESILKSYAYYPCQVWRLGEQPVMILGGEVVIEYAIEMKKLFGPDVFVIGYSNDLMSYIPSVTILKEGGYEGDTSQKGYGMPGIWSESIESKILQEMTSLANKAGIQQPH